MLLTARKKVLPLVTRGKIAGMYVLSDLKRVRADGANVFNVDKKGHLVVGAAIGAGDEECERAAELIKAGCDVIVIDTAHGDSKNVLDTLKKLKRIHPGTDIVAGNVSEGASAKRLAKAGADGIKVGQGPGSICTTRIVAGIGCPQVTAVYNCALAVRGSGVPICADGGIRHPGDITIAIGLGADCVMLGKNLAGTTESPGKLKDTRQGKMKTYRGMGSLGAMQDSKAARARYGQGNVALDKVIPEGVESLIPYAGDLKDVLHQLVGGLRSGMGYTGSRTLQELQRKANFHRLSGAGLRESHPHDVTVTGNQ
jgi:IMP dehydrogenase